MAYPVLLPNNSWFKSTIKSRSDFKTIRIVNKIEDYTPTEGVTASETWGANVVTDEFPDNSIACYVFGDELVVAGNDSGMIAANPDSSYMFGPKVTSLDNIQTFVNVTHVYGAELIDMSNVTTLERAFCYSLSLEYMNTSEWVLKNVKSIEYIFGVMASAGRCPIKVIDTEKWSMDSCEKFRNAFLNCDIEELNCADWVMVAAKDLYCMCRGCTSLKAIHTGKWVAPLLEDVGGTFQDCENIKELDFSGLGNAKAVSASKTTGTLSGTLRLEKIVVGSGFGFGNGRPGSPSDTYITGADGKWHTLRGESYTATNMPGNRAITYYASPLLVEKVLDTPVLLPGRTVLGMANAIREKTGGVDDLLPAEYEAAIRSI